MVSFRNTAPQNVGLCKKLWCLQTSLTPMYAYFRKHESSPWYCFETFCGFTFHPTCRTGFPLLFVRRVVTVAVRERSCSDVLLLLLILPWQHCPSIHPGVWQTDTQSVFARRRNRWPEFDTWGKLHPSKTNQLLGKFKKNPTYWGLYLAIDISQRLPIDIDI